MAFRIVPDDEVSAFLRPNDTILKSFIAGKDVDPHFVAPPPPIETMNRITKNLHSEFSEIGEQSAFDEHESIYLPAPSTKETVRVYLRVKPKTDEESHYYSIASTIPDDLEDQEPLIDADFKRPPEGEVVSIETDYQVALTAPQDSNAYKISINGNGNLIHRYAFTKIFPPEISQSGLFTEMVLPRVKDFLEGRNQLIFTYGATCSGKTFTIQGDSSRPGILPRALDVLFNSLGDKQLSSNGGEVNIKPLGFNRVATLVPREAERVAAEKKNIIKLGSELTQAMQFDTDVGADDSQTSIASVRSRVKDDTVVDMNSNSSLNYAIWVSFAEIYNENIYDLFEKMPEVKKGDTKPGRRSPLKLADDRGGSVYIKGLKEVFVTSSDEAYQLLMIGRQNLQFAATRLNHNSSRSHCIFTVKIVRVVDKDKPHEGRVCMLSFCDLAGSERIKKTLNTGERQKEAGNINTSLLVLGRVIKAIRHNQTIKETRKQQIVPFRDSKLTRLFQSFFTGLGKASMVVNVSQSPYLFDETLQVLKFSAIASKVHIEIIKEPKPMEFKKPMEEKAKKRKTRFSIMVENSKRSLLGGDRGSIAWENPQFRSTMVPNPGIKMNTETTVYEEEEDADETNEALEETVIDQRYDGFMKVIDTLKNQLIEEKQKNLKIETEVRTELCDEFTTMMADVEKQHEQRLQEEKDRASELSDWRISQLEKALKEKRKRDQRCDDEIEERLEEKSKDLDQLSDLYNSLVEEKKEDEAKIADLKNLLDEAKEEYISMDLKIHELKEELSKSNHASNEKEDLEKEVDELKQLLSEANSRSDEKELLVFELEEKVEKLTAEIEEKKRDDEENWKKKKATDLEVTTLNDEIENLVAEKKKLRALADDLEEKLASKDQERSDAVEHLMKENQKFKDLAEDEKKKLVIGYDKQLSVKDNEISNMERELKNMLKVQKQLSLKDNEVSNMERELKNMLKADKQNQEKITNIEAEVNMLRTQNKDINAKSAKTESDLKDKLNTISNLQLALDATKKKETVVETLQQELDRKSSEKEDLQFKVDKLQSDIEAKDYDYNRLKEGRDSLMNHYEQELKKKSEELTLEKRETTKLRQLIHSGTPKKKDDTAEKELKMLREELVKKSELIKTLASKVTTPKRNQMDSTTSSKEEGDVEVEKLQSEMEVLKGKHSAEMSKVKSAYDKIIKDFKDTNTELLRHVPASDAKRVMSVKRTVEDSEDDLDENVEPKSVLKKITFLDSADSSMVEATPASKNTSNKKTGRLTRGRRKKMSATTQVSFEDTSGSASILEPLCDSSNSKVLTPLKEDDQVPMKTPGTNRKRKLFPLTPGPDQFTPKDDDKFESGPVFSPHSIVKRQLRSRKKH